MIEILRWFERTHDLEVLGMSHGVYRLQRYPRAGGAEDQDARLLDALEHCRREKNALLARKRDDAEFVRELRERGDEQRRQRAAVH